MRINKWNPVHEMNRFLDDVFDHLPVKFGFDLAIDLYRDGDNLIAEMSAPGIDIKNTDIKVIDNVLHIRGHREERKEKHEKDYFSREIHRGSFERSCRLPSAVVPSETKATYKEGMLRVTMPVKKDGEEHKIKIDAD